MKLIREPNVTDKRSKRVATAVSFLFAITLYWAAKKGWLGETNQRFSSAFLMLMLVILGARAVLTELGIRRR